MDIKEIEDWLEPQLKDTWSNRDIKILAEVLLEQYQNGRFKGKSNTYGREYFAKNADQRKDKKRDTS